MSWMVRRRSWRTSSWLRATVSGVCSLWVSVCVRHRQLMCDRYWTGHAIETPAYDSRLAQNLMHTRCSFLWSIVEITTGHVHGSKLMRVKTTYVHPATCNLAQWLTIHGSPTIYRCFALPQLLYRWRHQSRIFWIPPRILTVRNWLTRFYYSTLHTQQSKFKYFNSIGYHYISRSRWRT
jgi:hypothetical protein